MQTKDASHKIRGTKYYSPEETIKQVVPNVIAMRRAHMDKKD
jgi:hypothetical protein